MALLKKTMFPQSIQSYSFHTSQDSTWTPPGMLENGSFRQSPETRSKEFIPTRLLNWGLGRPKGCSCIIWGTVSPERFRVSPKFLLPSGREKRPPFQASHKMARSPQSLRMWKPGEALYTTSQHGGSFKVRNLKNVLAAPYVTRYRWLWSVSYTQVSTEESFKLNGPQQMALSLRTPRIWKPERESFENWAPVYFRTPKRQTSTSFVWACGPWIQLK